MPLLQHINPQASSALNRFAQIYADEQAVLAEIFQTMIMPHLIQMDGRFFIPKAMFLGWHIAWQRKIFYHLLPISELTYAHVAHAIDVVHFGENGAIAQFPLGWQMRIDYDQLVIESTDASPFLPTEIPLLIDTDDVAISLDVAHEIDGRWFLHITQASQVHRLLPQASINIPPDAQMMLRTRRPSDRFAPLGLQGKHQSIKDWMINQKISKIMRPMIPLLTINNEIAVILYGKKFVTSHFFTIKEKNTPIYNIFVYFQNP